MAKRPQPGDAMWLYACPTCRARVGEYCRTPAGRICRTHKRRTNLVPVRRKKGDPARSVQAISGGAFEMNRRRH